jgi:hypothetical protein
MPVSQSQQYAAELRGVLDPLGASGVGISRGSAATGAADATPEALAEEMQQLAQLTHTLQQAVALQERSRRGIYRRAVSGLQRSAARVHEEMVQSERKAAADQSQQAQEKLLQAQDAVEDTARRVQHVLEERHERELLVLRGALDQEAARADAGEARLRVREVEAVKDSEYAHYRATRDAEEKLQRTEMELRQRAEAEREAIALRSSAELAEAKVKLDATSSEAESWRARALQREAAETKTRSDMTTGMRLRLEELHARHQANIIAIKEKTVQLADEQRKYNEGLAAHHEQELKRIQEALQQRHEHTLKLERMGAQQAAEEQVVALEAQVRMLREAKEREDTRVLINRTWGVDVGEGATAARVEAEGGGNISGAGEWQLKMGTAARPGQGARGAGLVDSGVGGRLGRVGGRERQRAGERAGDRAGEGSPERALARIRTMQMSDPKYTGGKVYSGAERGGGGNIIGGARGGGGVTTSPSEAVGARTPGAAGAARVQLINQTLGHRLGLDVSARHESPRPAMQQQQHHHHQQQHHHQQLLQQQRRQQQNRYGISFDAVAPASDTAGAAGAAEWVQLLDLDTTSAYGHTNGHSNVSFNGLGLEGVTIAGVESSGVDLDSTGYGRGTQRPVERSAVERSPVESSPPHDGLGLGLRLGMGLEVARKVVFRGLEEGSSSGTPHRTYGGENFGVHRYSPAHTAPAVAATGSRTPLQDAAEGAIAALDAAADATAIDAVAAAAAAAASTSPFQQSMQAAADVADSHHSSAQIGADFEEMEREVEREVTAGASGPVFTDKLGRYLEQAL